MGRSRELFLALLISFCFGDTVTLAPTIFWNGQGVQNYLDNTTFTYVSTWVGSTGGGALFCINNGTTWVNAFVDPSDGQCSYSTGQNCAANWYAQNTQYTFAGPGGNFLYAFTQSDLATRNPATVCGWDSQYMRCTLNITGQCKSQPDDFVALLTGDVMQTGLLTVYNNVCGIDRFDGFSGDQQRPVLRATPLFVKKQLSELIPDFAQCKKTNNNKKIQKK